MIISDYLQQRYKAIATLLGGVTYALLRRYFPDLFADDPTTRDLIAAIILSFIVERVPNKPKKEVK